MYSLNNISLLSVDELSNVLSFISQKELIKSCIVINKLFNAAIYHGNSWNYTRLSSKQLFKCKNDNVFFNFSKNAWNSLHKFSFMNYKKTLKAKQKQILQTRLISILNSSYNSLRSLQLQGVDISLFNDNIHNMKKLNNLNIIWISTAKRDNIINESVWINLISFSNLITLEFMSNFPLNVDDIRQLKSAFEVNRNGNKYQLKNLKLSIESNMDCNREIVYIIDLLCLSLETIFLTGMKYINEQTSICRSLCECKNLMVLSFMYRNVFDVNDLYSNLDCYNLLHELSLYLNGILKVLSLEYGPLINYEWQDRYKNHINKYFKSLIYVKIGQNRIKTPIVSTVISPNVKCNQFCLSFNANT